MAFADPSMFPFQLPGMEYGIWFWFALALWAILDLGIGRWMGREARTRDMNPWLWFAVGFLGSVFGLVAYLVIRRWNPVVSFRFADPKSNLYVRFSDLQIKGVHLSRLVVPAVGVIAGGILIAQVLLRPLDFFAYLFLFLGAVAIVLAYFTFHLRAWAWRGIVSILVGGSVVALIALIPFTTFDEVRLWIFAIAIAGGVTMNLFKVDFGVGPAYLQYLKERFQPHSGRAEVHNPDGLRCPSCGSAELFIAEDGSAFCNGCRKGFQQLRA